MLNVFGGAPNMLTEKREFVHGAMSDSLGKT